MPISKKILVSTKSIEGIKKKYQNKIFLSGFFLRKEVFEIKKIYLNKQEEKLSILIIGGSQGAMIFEKKIIPLIIQLSKKLNISICHQIKFDEKKYKEISETYQEHIRDISGIYIYMICYGFWLFFDFV